LPEGLCVSARRRGGRTILFLNNPTAERRKVSLPQPFTDVLLARSLSGPIVLEPFDVRVLEAQGEIRSPSPKPSSGRGKPGRGRAGGRNSKRAQKNRPGAV
jgi:hypothetical protein